MSLNSSFKKAIWAVDAFESASSQQQNAGRFIAELIQRTGIQVFPVYVLSAAQLNLSYELSGPWMHHYEPRARQALKDSLSFFQGPLEEPTVIVQTTSSKTEATDLLNAHAFQHGFDLIILSTHGRSGMRRLLLGSFAETLLAHVQVPVLAIGPDVRKPRSLDRILFPTEFGSHSADLFRNVLNLTKQFHSQLTVFHSIPHPIEPIFQSGVYLLGGAWIPIHSYFNEEIQRQTRHAKAWGEWASHQGVTADFIVYSEGGAISQAIIDSAKKKRAGMIVMETHSGPVRSALIGSITRQVLRHAPCPIMIYRAPLKPAKPSKKLDQGAEAA